LEDAEEIHDDNAIAGRGQAVLDMAGRFIDGTFAGRIGAGRFK
jgi:hypothetical protein